MFDFFNNRLFDLNRDGKVDIFEKAFVYHTLFEDDDKNVSRNDDYDDDDCDECDCDDCDDDFYDFLFCISPRIKCSLPQKP